MTTARHFDRFAAVAGHDEIVAMAPAAIYSCLVKDTSAGVALDRELAEIEATPHEVASTLAVMTAEMLTRSVQRDGRGTQASGQVDSQDHCPGSSCRHCP
jgi:hypothetical protein